MGAFSTFVASSRTDGAIAGRVGSPCAQGLERFDGDGGDRGCLQGGSLHGLSLGRGERGADPFDLGPQHHGLVAGVGDDPLRLGLGVPAEPLALGQRVGEDAVGLRLRLEEHTLGLPLDGCVLLDGCVPLEVGAGGHLRARLGAEPGGFLVREADERTRFLGGRGADALGVGLRDRAERFRVARGLLALGRGDGRLGLDAGRLGFGFGARGLGLALGDARCRRPHRRGRPSAPARARAGRAHAPRSARAAPRPRLRR